MFDSTYQKTHNNYYEPNTFYASYLYIKKEFNRPKLTYEDFERIMKDAEI